MMPDCPTHQFDRGEGAVVKLPLVPLLPRAEDTADMVNTAYYRIDFSRWNVAAVVSLGTTGEAATVNAVGCDFRLVVG